jgi:hypothetical protein
VVAIEAAQEYEWVYSAKIRATTPGAVSFEFVKEDRRVGMYLSVGGTGGQAGAPAANRGRMSLTPTRSGARFERSWKAK